MFGRLTVIGEGEPYIRPKTGHKATRWNCRCECGAYTLVQTGTLKSGKAKSCGCLQRELARDRMAGKPGQNAANLLGQRFGRLLVIEQVGRIGGRGVMWKCLCDCGNETIAATKELRSHNTKSCGCLRDEKISCVNNIHGESHTRLYNVWNGMRQRCKDPNHKSYHNYGGRGITFCDEWDDYTAFRNWALASGYDVNANYSDCTLDRIDVDGNYEPDNCRWVDATTQALNKRKSRAAHF